MNKQEIRIGVKLEGAKQVTRELEALSDAAMGPPLLSQRALRLLLIAYACICALCAALFATFGAEHTATQIVGVFVAAVAPAIGALSPGLRRAPPDA